MLWPWWSGWYWGGEASLQPSDDQINSPCLFWTHSVSFIDPLADTLARDSEAGLNTPSDWHMVQKVSFPACFVLVYNTNGYKGEPAVREGNLNWYPSAVNRMDEARGPDKETKANKIQIISSNLQGHWLLSIVRLPSSRDKQVQIKDNVSGKQKGGVGLCSRAIIRGRITWKLSKAFEIKQCDLHGSDVWSLVMLDVCELIFYLYFRPCGFYDLNPSQLTDRQQTVHLISTFHV